MGVGYINTPGIYSDEQIEAWKLVTKSVHKKDGKIFYPTFGMWVGYHILIFLMGNFHLPHRLLIPVV